MAQTLEDRLQAVESAITAIPPEHRECVRVAVGELFSSVADLPATERDAVLSGVQRLLRHVLPNSMEEPRFPAHGTQDKAVQEIKTIVNRLRR